MKDFDAVVFDMDGLIFDSERAGYECWSEVMKPFGFADILPLYREVIGCSRVRVEKVVGEYCGQDFPLIPSRKRSMRSIPPATAAERCL